MTRRVRSVLASAMAVVVMMAAGCGGTDEPADDETSSVPVSTEPALTAPPTVTPEEQAEAEILATFEDLIASWDEFKANASDYDTFEGWNVALVEQWPVERSASADLANWIAYWKASAIEQIGYADVARHDVTSLRMDVSDSGVHDAESWACLDMSALTYVSYDGEAAEIPVAPALHQTWDMVWVYSPVAEPDFGIEAPGWYLQKITVSIDEPC